MTDSDSLSFESASSRAAPFSLADEVVAASSASRLAT